MTPFLLIAAILVGASVEIGLTTLTGRTEAFDSEKYLLAGYPVICVTSGILAFIQPRRRFLWGVAPMLSQLLIMLFRSIPGSYWPAALAVSSFYFIGPLVCALIGAGMRLAPPVEIPEDR